MAGNEAGNEGKAPKRPREYTHHLAEDEVYHGEDTHVLAVRKRGCNRVYLFCKFCNFKTNSPPKIIPHLAIAHHEDYTPTISFTIKRKKTTTNIRLPTPTKQASHVAAVLDWLRFYENKRTFTFAKYCDTIPTEDRLSFIFQDVRSWVLQNHPPEGVYFARNSILLARTTHEMTPEADFTNLFENLFGSLSLPPALQQFVDPSLASTDHNVQTNSEQEDFPTDLNHDEVIDNFMHLVDAAAIDALGQPSNKLHVHTVPEDGEELPKVPAIVSLCKEVTPEQLLSLEPEKNIHNSVIDCHVR